MGKISKKGLPVFEPTLCTCCGQTTDYEIALDKGTALTVLAIYNAVRKKGENRVHIVDEMVVNPSEYSSYQEMVNDGKMTLRMEGNRSRARFHGLIAFTDGGGDGEYLITPKGARFLRNEEVPRVAIIDKATHHKSYYFNEENDRTTFTKLLRKETPFWDIVSLPYVSDGTENVATVSLF